MSVSDAKIEALGLKDFFRIVDETTVNFGKEIANKPVRRLEIASKIGSAAATKNHGAALTVSFDSINFATT